MALSILPLSNNLYPSIPGFGVVSRTSWTENVFYTLLDVTSGAGTLNFVTLGRDGTNIFDNIRITVDGIATTISTSAININLNIYFYSTLKVEVSNDATGSGTARIAEAHYSLI